MVDENRLGLKRAFLIVGRERATALNRGCRGNIEGRCDRRGFGLEIKRTSESKVV